MTKDEKAAGSNDEKVVRYGCIDCNPRRVGDWYLVIDHVWFIEAKMGRKDNLCLVHLEKRLGRQLVIEDFTTASCNSAIIFGYTMGRRVS